MTQFQVILVDEESTRFFTLLKVVDDVHDFPLPEVGCTLILYRLMKTFERILELHTFQHCF